MSYNELSNQEIINKTVSSLKNNGIEAFVVETAQDANAKVRELVPAGSEIMTMSSQTLVQSGIDELLNDTTVYNPVRAKLYSLDRATQKKEMNIIGGVHDFAVGSANAITENGEILHASLTGSQIPSYAAGASKVIYVISTKKIEADLGTAVARIREHVLPLESERAKIAYGVPGSAINKMLITFAEFPGRITVILVKEDLGY